MSVSGAVLNSQIIDEAIGRSLEVRILRFNRGTKLTIIVQKFIQKICGQTKGGGGRIIAPPPLSIRH